MLEWSVPEDVELTPRSVKRANPASWIRIEDLAAQMEAIPDLAFRRFHAGQWTERASYWLPPGTWQQCVGEPKVGHEIYVGVDVGGQRSATAVAWVDSDLQAGVWIGRGDEAVLKARDVIRELARDHTIVECAFDPWRAGQLAAGAGGRAMCGLPAVGLADDPGVIIHARRDRRTPDPPAGPRGAAPARGQHGGQAIAARLAHRQAG
jgi:hypothetical protein